MISLPPLMQDGSLKNGGNGEGFYHDLTTGLQRREEKKVLLQKSFSISNIWKSVA